MTANIIKVKISDLSLSPLNLRQEKPNQQSLKELAANIKASGLIHPLSVFPGKRKNHYQVIAGGRRLAALLKLVADGTMKKCDEVACQVYEEEDATQISLAENTLRETMNAGDELAAFQKMIDEGKTIVDIAQAFGVSQTVVKKRLKLANVAPEILDQYRQGKIELEVLQAFAVTDDHSRQNTVFGGLRRWQLNSSVVRAALTETELAASDKLVRFVGLETYKKAGGGLRRDLFASGDTSIFLCDPDLLQELAAGKFKAITEQVAGEGWRFVEARNRDEIYQTGYRHEPPTKLALSAAQEARMSELAAALEEFDERGGDDHEKWTAMENEYDELENAGRGYSDDQKAFAGIFLVLNHLGDIVRHEGYVRPADEPAGDDDCGGGGAGKAAGQSTPLSASLREDLSVHLTLGLQASLLAKPELAGDLLLAEMLRKTFDERFGYPAARFEISLGGAAELAREEFVVSPASEAMAAARAGWAKRLPWAESELFAFVVGLTETEKAGALAYCLAQTIDVVDRRSGNADRQAIATDLAEILDTDLSKTFKATAKTYFSRVPKNVILDAIREGQGEDAADNLKKLKKPALAEAAEERLAESGWLPEPLRLQAATAA